MSLAIISLLLTFFQFCACQRAWEVTTIVRPTADPWPQPKSLTTTATRVALNADTFVFKSTGAQCDILDAAFKRYAAIIIGEHRDKNKSLTFMRGEASSSADTEDALETLSVNTGTDCKGVYPSLSSDESYELNVTPTGAVLNSNEVWGALRGLETFSQLVYKLGPGQFVINQTTVEDAPRFSHRGLMLDTARHYLKKEKILETVELMAQNKFNVFHWHMVDDQSFPFVSKTFPDLSAKGAYSATTHIYTPSDVQEIIEFARIRGVRVMVEFDSPGHALSWGKGIPDLLTKCYTEEKENGKFGPMDPTVNSTFEFLESFFSEVASTFPDDYLFLGGDEVDFTCWKSNPDVTKFMKAMGLGTDYAQLEGYYVKRLLEIVSSLKKKSMVWQEVVDNGAKLDSDTIVNVWRHLISKSIYQKELAKVTKLGYTTVLSACWYLGFTIPGGDWHRFYRCDPHDFTGTQEQKDLVVGGEACLWGEFVDDTNLTPRLWPRASAVAERLWSPASATSDIKEAASRLAVHRCRMVRRGYAAQEPNGPSVCAEEL